MSKLVISKEKIVAVADAVREKTGTSDGYSLDTMPDAIRGIETGGGGADFTISDASNLFNNGARLDKQQELLSILDTKLTDMSSMYNGCKSMTSVDLSRFNTSEVKSMRYLFYNCQQLKNLDLSTFNTENVTDMDSMFCTCSKLENIDVTSFNTSKVTTMYQMFASCEALKNIDLSGFNTSNVTNMGSMFSMCKNLTSIDLSNFDTSKTTSFSSIFSSCNNLEEITGFSATNKAGISIAFPSAYTVSSAAKLKRLTFRTDLPDGVYSIRSAINIKYCSFDRDGMVEMFNTLPDINAANVSANYKKITITGNPCVNNGTLTEEDKAIATNKGWTLVE